MSLQRSYEVSLGTFARDSFETETEILKRHDDTDQHRQSTGRNRPPSYWDLAKFFYFLQTTLVDCDGNRADLPVSISFDALQRRGAAESDRRFKHHSTVQPSLFQADYHVGQ